MPIIAISASVFPDTQQKGIETGCDDFIVKPFQVEQVLEALRTNLNLEWLYAEPSQAQSETEAQHTPGDIAALIAALSPEDAERLHTSAMRGNRKEVLAQLARIENLDTRFVPLVTELRALAKSFDLDAIAARLEE